MRSECWGSAPLFPDELDSESVPGLQVTSEDTLYISKQILSFLEVTGSDPEIERALRTAVRRGSRALRLLPVRKRGYYAKRRLHRVGCRLNRLLGESNGQEPN